ncbi:MAG: galactokinase family protein [Clostridia bacterium]|nr:galactokinase family protein [Clostridia bacterium]
MLNTRGLSYAISSGEFDRVFYELYGDDTPTQRIRYISAIDALLDKSPGTDEVAIISSPGRIELIGSYTEAHGGRAVGCAINPDCIGVAARISTPSVTLLSHGFPGVSISTDSLSRRRYEGHTPRAILRGICYRFIELGYQVGGMLIFTDSNIPSGFGLASSSAIEMLVACAMNTLYNDSAIPPEVLADIAQWVEINYFMTSGSMLDQITVSTGGALALDFAVPGEPLVEPLDLSFAFEEHTLAVVNPTSASVNTTNDCAAILDDLKSIADFFGATSLIELDESEFYGALCEVRKTVYDRAIVRAMHFFNENRRVDNAVAAIKARDVDGLLYQIRQSGAASFATLQNCYPLNPMERTVVLALALAEQALEGRGACRVHGAGFACPILAVVPNDLLPAFARNMRDVFGDSSLRTLNVRHGASALFI